MLFKSKILVISSLGVICMVLFWAVVIEPRIIDVVYYKVEVPQLPREWDGEQIAFICDLQVGMWLGNDDTVRRIIDRIIAYRPAVVLVGGDFIYHPTEDDSIPEALEEFDEEERAEAEALIDRVCRMLLPLTRAGLQVYAVLGNHDYAMETKDSLKLAWVAEILTARLEKSGVQVLNNETVVMKKSGSAEIDLNRPLYLVGIGPHYPGQADVQKAFSGLPETGSRIVMMHNPQTFESIPAGQAPLALAGHTHGGQIRIPFLHSWTWLSIVADHEVHADGWIRDFGQPNNRLYVNRGIGFSLVPVRLNCRPELTYFTLTRAHD